MRRGILTLIAALIGALFLTTSPAYAGPITCPPGSTPIAGNCVIVVDPGGGGGGGGTTPVDNPGGGGGSQECRKASGEVVPCQTEHGYWNGACYDKDVSAEFPDKSDPIWQGHEDGVILRQTCIGSDGSVPIVTRWEASAPGVAGPSPRELADRAVQAMDFRAGQIATAPPPLSVQPDGMAIVGIPVWLWVGDPGESTTGPITRSASGGGTTVTATGTLDRIVYTMGDGGQVTCTGPGTPYRTEYGDRTSPDCGYTYTKTSAGKASEAHTISATSYWTVEWAGGGQTGTIPLEFTRTEQLRVGELQVLLTTP